MYKVVVVDDEPFMLEAWQLFVDWEAHGFRLCAAASDGKEALKAITDFMPDLVMTDIEMPVMDGLELIRRIRENDDFKTMKMIIVSGYSRFEAAKLAIRYQVEHYLLKPLIAEEIHQVLDELRIKLEENAASLALTRKEQEGAISAALSLALREDDMEITHALMKLLETREGSPCQLLFVEIRKKEDPAAHQSGIRSTDVCAHMNQFAMPSGMRFCCFDEAPGVIGLFVWGSSDSATFDLGVRKMANHLTNGYPGLFVHVSSGTERWSELPRMRQQAMEVRGRYMYSNVPGVYYFDRLHEAEDCCFEEAAVKAELLLAAVDRNDHETIRKEADKLTALIAKTKVPTGWLSSCISFVQSGLLRRFHQAGGNPICPPDWLIVERRRLGEFGQYRAEALTEAWIRAAMEIEQLKGRRQEGPVDQAISFVKERYREKLQLKDIAERFHLSPVYLGQQFKRETGYHFNDYIHLLRIEEAKKMLRRTDMKVSDIAHTLGYHDTEYFTSIFKALTNVSPSTYKTNQKGERNDDAKALFS